MALKLHAIVKQVGTCSNIKSFRVWQEIKAKVGNGQIIIDMSHLSQGHSNKHMMCLLVNYGGFSYPLEPRAGSQLTLQRKQESEKKPKGKNLLRNL